MEFRRICSGALDLKKVQVGEMLMGLSFHILILVGRTEFGRSNIILFYLCNLDVTYPLGFFISFFVM